MRHHVKADLRIRLREYFKYRLTGNDVHAHTSLLKQMSPALRAEITMQMNTWITKVDFFRQCPEALVIQLTMAVHQQTYPPQEKIIVPGDWCDRMYMVRKGVVICRQRIMTTGQVFCVECLYKEGKVAYSAHAVTYADMYYFDRAQLLSALYYFPDMKRHFQVLSVKRVFHDEVMAYATAFRALRDDGASATLDNPMDERPAAYLKKLRSIFGHDGAGMHEDVLQKQKDAAAGTVQRWFRGIKTRIQIQAKATESKCPGVFDRQIRKMDAAMYAARAIDVFHHRAGVSLHSLHLKVDSLLTGDPVAAGPASEEADGASYLRAERDPNIPAGEKSRVLKPKKAPMMKQVTVGAVVFATPSPQHAPGWGAGGREDGGGDGDGDGEGRDGRGGSAGSSDDAMSALERRVSRGMAAAAARSSALEQLVSDLAVQVGAVAGTLGRMSQAQTTFQERSQRTILAHLEQAQARIWDQVAAGPGAGAGGGGGPRQSVGQGGLPGRLTTARLSQGLTESDPPPVTLQRRPPPRSSTPN